jgi:hypothetical protein
MAHFIEIDGDLVNLDKVQKVTYDQELDRTTLYYSQEYTTDHFHGDRRAEMLGSAAA